MTWKLSDSAAIATISGGSELPTDINRILEDAAWNHVFSVWANDTANGAQTGDDQARVWLEFWTDCKKLDVDLDKKYFSDSATVPVPYDQALMHMWGQRKQSPWAIDNQLADIAAQRLDEKYWDDFSDDVREASKTAASDPQASDPQVSALQVGVPSAPRGLTLTRDRIDQAVVDDVNQAALKNLAEGSSIGFLMRGDLLLIGDNHAPTYVEFAKYGGNEGTLKMKAKGGAFSTGEVVVQQESWLDPAALKEAIRRFSQKKVTVGDLS
jgi:hypothetical protein